MDLMPIARSLALFALVLLVIAGVLFLASKLNLSLGKLPGDIIIKTGNFSCAVPLVSSLLLSILITVILNLLLALLRK
jgi:hypothetical protein